MRKLILIIIILILTGCYNYQELSNLSVASSIYIKYDDEYIISVEVYDEDKTNIITSTGSTLSNAFNNLNNKSSKEIYYQHLNTLFINETINIEELIYYFLRNTDVNSNFYIVYTNDDIYIDNEINLGEKISNILHDQDIYTFFNISKSIINNSYDIFIPIYKDDSIDNIMLYKDNTPIYTLEDSNILYIILDIDNTLLYNKCDTDYFILDINSSNITYEINDNNIEINLNIKSYIKELNCNIDTTTLSGIELLETTTINNLKNNINEFINILYQYDIDTLGLNRIILNNTHEDISFTNYTFNINIDLKIYKKGLLLK